MSGVKQHIPQGFTHKNSKTLNHIIGSPWGKLNNVLMKI